MRGEGRQAGRHALPFFRLSPSDYEGLHQRYSALMGDDTLTLALEDDARLMRKKLTSLFDDMMKVLFRQKGANLEMDILASDEAQEFIATHAAILDGSFRQVEMSDAMRRALQRSDYIFSGLKTFHELNEAFPSLLDENGNRKTFERFLNDVRKIDSTYNARYLRAEYNFAQASAAMAAKWEEFTEDGDRYNLQYRTAGDARVRPEHAEMAGITLPPSSPFWRDYLPPNMWGCRCSAVQVRKEKYPETPLNEAMQRAQAATVHDVRGMFRFNSGIEQKTFPDYNPYTTSRCKDCDIAKGKLKLAKTPIPDNELCQACRFLRQKTDQETIRRLNKEERKEIIDAALEWADKHLPRIKMADGTQAARLTVTTSDGYNLHIGKKFFTETFSKCKNSRRIAETMETATLINEWINNAYHVRTEEGRHHDFNFAVFKAEYNGKEIEIKAKMTDGMIVYLMKLL